MEYGQIGLNIYIYICVCVYQYIYISFVLPKENENTQLLALLLACQPLRTGMGCLESNEFKIIIVMEDNLPTRGYECHKKEFCIAAGGKR